MKRVVAVLIYGVVVTAASAQVGGGAPFEFALAKMLAQEGQYAEAADRLGRVLELAPDDPYVRIELAGVLLRLGRTAEALEQAEVATGLAPEDPEVLRVAGRVHLTMASNDPAERLKARAAFEKLRELQAGDLQTLMALGEIYLSEGRPDKAAEIFDLVSRRRPDNRVVSTFLVDALLASGQNAEAVLELDSILAIDPGYLKGRLSLADLHSERGDHEAAATTLLAAPEADRLDDGLRRRLALELYHAGRLAEARVELDAVLEDDPSYTGGRFLRAMIQARQGDSASAESGLRALLLESPGSLDVGLQLARLLESGEQVDAARSVLEDLLAQQEPGGAELYVVAEELAFLLARADRWAEVLEVTGPMLDDPGDPLASDLIFLRAEILSRLDRDEEALALLARVPGTSPHAIRALARETDLLFALDRPVEAEERLDRLSSMDGMDGLLLAAEVLQRRLRFDDSIPLLERAAGESPDSVQVMFALGAAYERVDRRNEAVSVFRRLLSNSPDFAPALNYLGYMWAERGENLPEALKMVDRAVTLDPDNGAYVDSLGWALFRLGRHEQALDQLERAAELIPDDSVIFEHLGDVYSVLGQVDQAREVYRRAVELGGQNEEQVRGKLRELTPEPPRHPGGP